MTRRIGVVVVFCLLAAAAAQAQTYGVVMTGSQERPTPTTSTGWGNATVSFDSTRSNINVTITVRGLTSAITGAHIHEKAAGSDVGNIVVGFTPSASFTNGKLTGTFTMDTPVAARLVANPSNFYMNVHTSVNPGGEIRGDLTPISGQFITYANEMRGTNETPPTSSSAVGAFFITIDTINKTLTWDVTSNVANPTLAHIHPGAAGVAGSPLITFATSASAFTNGRTSGTTSIAGLSDANFNALITTPQNFYVNVHSTTNGGGEIRGQLAPANEDDMAVAGRVTNALGQTFVTDARVFNPSYDAPAVALLEYFASGTTANTTATATKIVDIPARGTAVLNDLAGSSGFNITGTGAVRVSNAGSLIATSRIFNDLRSSGKGTFGQFVPSVNRGNALRRGAMTQLSNQSDLSSGSRTNIGFFNPNPVVVTVRLELRAADGTLLGQSTQFLQPLSQQQNGIGGYFSGVDLTNAQNLTLSFDASAPIDMYASVVDNVATDQIFVGAQEDLGVAAQSP
ncbi:MAG TPA: CHRD domain-containing protein [Thermoanaerobaculia bacterium]|nr:CHRD domain-containing protein [Thermoanaerobaculia bacterium]